MPEATEKHAAEYLERFMAGLQAGRALGGDGRCSCSFNDPTSCGVPPPDFEKSAHLNIHSELLMENALYPLDLAEEELPSLLTQRSNYQYYFE